MIFLDEHVLGSWLAGFWLLAAAIFIACSPLYLAFRAIRGWWSKDSGEGGASSKAD